MISKDLERIIELSSREVTDEEGIEHFNLKNKLEELLEKGDETVDLRTALDWYKGAYEIRKKKYDTLKQKLDEYQKWLERDVNALKVNQESETVIKAFEHQNTKLKEILQTTKEDKRKAI